MARHLATAPPGGAVHRVAADAPRLATTLCGKPASSDLGGAEPAPWPRWSWSDRGVVALLRRSCEICRNGLH